MINWSINHSAPVVVPSQVDIAKIEERFGPYLGHARVFIEPRSRVYDVTGIQAPPYAFRAVTRGNDSFVFTDGTETPDSVAWLIGHELSHQLVDTNRSVGLAMADGRPIDVDPKSDAFHLADPEERLADGITTRLFGTRYDRTWWRKRTPVSFGGLDGAWRLPVRFGGRVC